MMVQPQNLIVEFLSSKISEEKEIQVPYRPETYPDCIISLLGMGCLFANPFFAAASIMPAPLSIISADRHAQICNATRLLGEYQKVSYFCKAFKDFELNPTDKKAIDLFAEFSELKGQEWIKFLKEKELIHSADLLLLESLGSLFLMDAACTFLKAKKIESEISTSWDKVLEMHFNEIKKVQEPWSLIYKSNPDLDAYYLFFENRDKQISTEFADTIHAIFERVVQNADNAQLI